MPGSNEREKTIRQLHELTGRSERTCKKALAHVQPVRTDAKARYYDPQQALPLIYELESGRLDPNQEKALLSAAQRRKIELYLALQEGRQIDIEVAGEAVQNDYATLRTRLLAIPHLTAPLHHECAADSTVAKHKAITAEAIRSALSALADGEGLAALAGKASPAAGANGESVGGRGADAEQGVQRGAGAVADGQVPADASANGRHKRRRARGRRDDDQLAGGED